MLLTNNTYLKARAIVKSRCVLLSLVSKWQSCNWLTCRRYAGKVCIKKPRLYPGAGLNSLTESRIKVMGTFGLADFAVGRLNVAQIQIQGVRYRYCVSEIQGGKLRWDSTTFMYTVLLTIRNYIT